MFSSATVNWSTPQWFFDQYNQQYNFTLDVCALPENAKCLEYFTPDDNGLNQTWEGTVVDESTRRETQQRLDW